MHRHVQRIVRVAAAALVAAPALALAQTGPMPPGQRNPRNPTTPTPTPAPTPSSPTATPPGQQMPGGESAGEVTQTLKSLRSLDAFAIQAGTLASQRANNARLKDFGSRMAKDHENIDQGLVQFATQRSLALGAHADMNPSDKSALQSLEKLNGADFDREFSNNVISRHESYVQQLKDMRDRTPGKDPTLKKWLDDAENVEEAHLTEARQIRQQMRDQTRQARTPAKK